MKKFEVSLHLITTIKMGIIALNEADAQIIALQQLYMNNNDSVLITEKEEHQPRVCWILEKNE